MKMQFGLDFGTAPQTSEPFNLGLNIVPAQPGQLPPGPDTSALPTF